MHTQVFPDEANELTFKKIPGTFVLPERGERIVQPGFHRASRNVRCHCDFGHRKVVHKSQQNDLAVLQRQIGQRR